MGKFLGGVNEIINLSYSQDQGYSYSFRVRVWFRAILLCLILKKGFSSLLNIFMTQNCHSMDASTCSLWVAFYHQSISNQSVPATLQSYSQSQARLMVVTLGMDNFDCTKMNAQFKKFTACLWEGLIHKWKQALLAPPLPLILLNNSWLCSTHQHSSAFFSTVVCYQQYIAHSS